MAENATEDWQKSQIRPTPRGSLSLVLAGSAFCGVFMLAASWLAMPTGDGTTNAGFEFYLVVGLAFWAAYTSYQAAKATRVPWNDRPIRNRRLYLARAVLLDLNSHLSPRQTKDGFGAGDIQLGQRR